jgi:hypothetical protein
MMSKSKDPKANTLKGLLIAGVVALALGGAALLLLWNPFSSSEAIGQRAPDFTLSDSEGRPLHLSALYRIQARGTMLLLDAQGQILFRGIRAVRDPEFMRQLTKATAGS